jgi:predicted RNase H-like nuclease (RuvC/YqgF family)
MPADIISIGDASKIKELQNQLAQKQEELEALQKQFDEFKNSTFLLISGSELMHLQLNELMAFLQTNIKNYQGTLQNLQTIKNKLPTVSSNK